MGSRTHPNAGGSGQQKSRIGWAVSKRNKRPQQLNAAFKNLDDLDAYLSTALIVCLECGGEFKSLGHHLCLSHAMSSNEYRIKYNIPKSRSLCGTSLRAEKSAITKGIWKSGVMENVRGILKERITKIGVLANVGPRQSNIHLKSYTKACKTCGELFTRKAKKHIYCSAECYHNHPSQISRRQANSLKGGAVRRATAIRNKHGVFVNASRESDNS